MDALDAELYAALHVGTPGDVAWYQAVCAGAARVVELGAGWGRVAAPLAGAGAAGAAGSRSVIAVEREAALIALGRERLGAVAGLRFELGDFLEWEPDGPVDRVLVPYSTIYTVASDAALERLFARARGWLAEGGALCLDVWLSDAFHDEAEPWEPAWDALDPVTVAGRSYRVDERSTWDRAARTVTAEYRFVSDSVDARRHEVTHHYRSSRELVALLIGAGFGRLRAAGGFDGRPLDDEAELLTLEARP